MLKNPTTTENCLLNIYLIWNYEPTNTKQTKSACVTSLQYVKSFFTLCVLFYGVY